MSAFDRWIVNQPLRQLITGRGEWRGTPSKLLVTLERLNNKENNGLSPWPGSARVLTMQLKGYQARLADLAIGVWFWRTGKARRIVLRELAYRRWVYDLPSTNGIRLDLPKPQTRGEVTRMFREQGAAARNIRPLDKRP